MIIFQLIEFNYTSSLIYIFQVVVYVVQSHCRKLYQLENYFILLIFQVNLFVKLVVRLLIFSIIYLCTYLSKVHIYYFYTFLLPSFSPKNSAMAVLVGLFFSSITSSRYPAPPNTTNNTGNISNTICRALWPPLEPKRSKYK